MKSKLTSFLLTALLSVLFFAPASHAAKAPSLAAEENLFSYEITSPEEGQETFYSINLRFPKAASVAYIPGFMDRSNYIEFKKDGVTFTPQYAYPALDENEIQLDLGGVAASSADRWEVIIQPGLFNLLDENEDVIAANPLLEIVVTEGPVKSDVDFTFTAEPDNTDSKLLLAELSKVSFTFPGLSAISAAADAPAVSVGGTTVDKAGYTVSAAGNVVTVNFSPAITSTEDVTVTVTFPEKTLTGTQGETTGTNKMPVEASYTVVPAAAYDLAIDFYQPKPDADGNISADAAFGMLMFICDIPNVKAASGNTITMKEVNGDFESTASLMTLTGQVSGKSTFYTSLESPVYNGKYTITIPKGSVGDTRWRTNHELGHSNDEIVLTFNVINGQDRPSTPHIDLSVAYTGTEAVAVKGVPSEDNIYWYANIIEASRYPGDKEMLESVINFFKLGAETFNMNWITVYQMTAKTGEYTWGFGDLLASSDYIVYALGLDDKGELYMPVTKIPVRTADMIVSDNTFTVETISVEDGTQPETKKLTIKVTPTNDDPYAAVILDKYITDGFDLTSPADEKNYLRNALRPLVTKDRVYTGEQTIVFDNIKIDAIMQAAVFGYEGYETTSPVLADFSTVDDNFEAMTIEAYDPTISGASATVASFDLVRPYIFGVISKEAANEIGGIETIHENYNVPMWTAAGMGYYDWRYYARRDLHNTPLDGTLSEIAGISSLKWETEYYMYGYLMDNGGYRTSPVYFTEFSTTACNKTDNTFVLKLNSIASNAPYSPNTFMADMTIVPTDDKAPYALYYGDTYDFEEYLNEGRLDDWMYDVFMQRRVKKTYSGELNFGYGSVYPDKDYILIVTGFDEAPNTEPAWMLFNKDGEIKNTTTGLSYIKDSVLRIYADGSDICIDGEFTDAKVYATDGILVGTFAGNKCCVNAPGYYIVRVQTGKDIVTRKVAVK